MYIEVTRTSARYQPNGIFLVAGLPATQMEKSEIMNDAKSVNKCAASVAIAKLFDNTPPERRNKINKEKLGCLFHVRFRANKKRP